jgi:hypothetical protein
MLSVAKHPSLCFRPLKRNKPGGIEMQSYSINITVSEKMGSYDGSIRAEISGLDTADGIERKGEMVSVLLEKIKEYGKLPASTPWKTQPDI